MSIVYIDTETSIHPIHGPRPMYGAQAIICAYAIDHGPVMLINRPDLISLLGKLPASDLVVGHNLQFDLNHLDQTIPLYTPWDTQYGAYLLSSCSLMYATLDEAAKQANVIFKKDPDIEAFFKAGQGADEIMAMGDAMRRRFTKYLMNDVEATRKVYLKQVAAVTAKEQLPLMRLAMRSLTFLTAAYDKGMPLNKSKLASGLLDSQAVFTNSKLEAFEHMLKLCPELINAHDVTPGSRSVVLPLINGGKLLFGTRKEAGVFKKGAKQGKVRYKHTKVEITVPWQADNTPSLQRKDLQTLWPKLTGPRHALVESLLRYKDSEKYAGILNGMWTHMMHGILRPNITLVGTNTGRKASSKPNGQNLPTEARQYVEAPPGFKIVTFDLKQIEVICWAVSTGDPNLLADLNNGVDIHGRAQENINKVYGFKLERVNVKRIIFGTIYGGGPSTLSRQSGASEDACKAVIEHMKATYPVAMGCHKAISKKMHETGTFFDPETGHTERKATCKLPGEQSITFRTYEGRYSYTEMRNRPIQALAALCCIVAESVMIDAIANTTEWSTASPIMQVHDEVVVVADVTARQATMQMLAEKMAEEVHKFLLAHTGYDVAVGMEFGEGPTWADCK